MKRTLSLKTRQNEEIDVIKAESIRRAIISDDVKILKTLLDTESAKLCFGRFPLLSLAYLYSSSKVINKYETVLSKITEYTIMEECYEDYVRFKKYAGKSLRLYLNGQIISPLEMGAILSDNPAVKANVSDTTNLDRVKKIYRLTHEIEPQKKGNGIVIPRTKKARREQIIAVITIISICAVCLCGALVAMNVVPKLLGNDGSETSPLKILSSKLFEQALGDDNRYYILEDDLVLGTNVNDKNFKIHVDGNGKTITINTTGERAIFKDFSGSLKNANIVINVTGKKIPKNSAFLVKSLMGKLTNVNVTISTLDVTLESEGALVVHTSSGTITNVTLNASGKVSEVSALEETILGTLLYKNNGTLSNSSVKYNLEVIGDARNTTSEETSTGDAVFGGIVGINNSNVIDCKVEGGSTLTSDTIDVGGIAVDNSKYATISGSENNANLSQTTPSTFWSPNIGGITMRNQGKIVSSKNNGSLTASTNQDTRFTEIILGGISTTNNGTIEKCENYGAISSSLKLGYSYTSGVCTINDGSILLSNNYGSIASVTTSEKAPTISFENFQEVTKTTTAYVGGIVVSSGGSVENSNNHGNLSASTKVGILNVGGIGYLNRGTISNSTNNGSITATSSTTQTYSIEHHVAGGLAVNVADAQELVNNGNVEVIVSKGCTAFVGGIAGLNNNVKATISGSENHGNITANTSDTEKNSMYVGGITAYHKGTLTSSVNYGSFTTETSSETLKAGGVIGLTVKCRIENTEEYDHLSDYVWSDNHYVNDLGYENGIGDYTIYVVRIYYDVFTGERQYSLVEYDKKDGDNDGATPISPDEVERGRVE